jgi:hypothetical protein
MQIMVFSKARPAALEKHITLTIVVYFYFIWGSITRHLSQNSFTKLSTIHEFSKFERKALLFTALGASKSKKENKTPADGCGGLGCAKFTSRCSLVLVGVAEVLTLFLLPNG